MRVNTAYKRHWKLKGLLSAKAICISFYSRNGKWTWWTESYTSSDPFHVRYLQDQVIEGWKQLPQPQLSCPISLLNSKQCGISSTLNSQTAARIQPHSCTPVASCTTRVKVRSFQPYLGGRNRSGKYSLNGTTNWASLYVDGSLIFPGTTASPVLLAVHLHRLHGHGCAGSFSAKLWWYQYLNCFEALQGFLASVLGMCCLTERSNKFNHPVSSKQQLMPQTSNLLLKPFPAKGIGTLLEPPCIQLMDCHTDLSQLSTDNWKNTSLKRSFPHLTFVLSQLPFQMPNPL